MEERTTLVQVGAKHHSLPATMFVHVLWHLQSHHLPREDAIPSSLCLSKTTLPVSLPTMLFCLLTNKPAQHVVEDVLVELVSCSAAVVVEDALVELASSSADGVPLLCLLLLPLLVALTLILKTCAFC